MRHPRRSSEVEDGPHKDNSSPSRAPAPAAPADQILDLQRSAGNAAVQRMLTADAPVVGGLLPNVPAPGEEEPEVMLGGIEEAVGDVARPVGTAVGNVFGSAVGALTGISISSTTNGGPTWSDHGAFDWRVGFTTSGASGWIVQEVNNTYDAKDSSGAALGPPKPTKKYWEAWEVDAASAVTPDVGGTNDFWLRPSRGNGTKGHWSMTGHVYFTTTDPKTQGFTPGGVADAGILLSTTTAPSGLGLARLHRFAQGTWDSTGSTPTHTGSAGP